MGLQLVALAKLKLVAMAHSHGSLITAMVWPFIVRIPFGRRMSGAYADLAASSAFFFFRLRRILLYNEPVHNGGRWERAIRLFRERVIDPRRYSTGQTDEDSFHAVSMLAL